MYKFDNQLIAEDRHNGFASLVLLMVVLLAGLLIAGLASHGLTMLTFGLEEADMKSLALGEGDVTQYKGPLIFMQALNSILLFIVTPLTFLYFVKGKSWRDLNGQGQPSANYYAGLVFLTMLVSYFFLPVNSVIIEWNMSIKFPESMSGFEETARSMEDRAQHITSAITKFDSLGDLFVGIIVIGLLPAIGEELLFRGLLQNVIQRITKNAHLAIFITGILFSAFHFQLFGFVPRMLLGILFGYLYVWSRNIWIPIWAHFVNNGGTVIMMYLFQQGQVKYDIENEGGFSPTNLIIHTVLFVGVLYLFWRVARQREEHVHESPMAENL